MARGEGTTQLTNLTGRTNFWGPLLAYPRTTFQEIFGFEAQLGERRARCLEPHAQGEQNSEHQGDEHEGRPERRPRGGCC